MVDMLQQASFERVENEVETGKGSPAVAGLPVARPLFFFFFFFDSEFLFRAHTTKRYRGGHVCYVLRLGMYV